MIPQTINILSGTDISEHYFHDPEAAPFKIYRYQENVYAIRYNNSEPIDAVWMWRSHKETVKQSKTLPTTTDMELGKGKFGTVFAKTTDKAIKKLHPLGSEKLSINILDITNVTILQQKFKLCDAKIIDQNKCNIDFCVMGLWNIKETAPRFIMPIVSNYEYSIELIQDDNTIYKKNIIYVERLNVEQIQYHVIDLAGKLQSGTLSIQT